MLQKLSPQQIQLMKLLQVPAAALEERIKEEMEINPALEEGAEEQEQNEEEIQEEYDGEVEGEDYEKILKTMEVTISEGMILM